MKMKLTGFALAGLVVLTFSVSSVALAAGGLTGTYTTTLKSPDELKGAWKLALAQGGSYVVALNGQNVARGRYASTASTITFDRERGSGCTGAGTYGWKKSGKYVTFVRKNESSSCKARAIVFTHRFTQVR